MTTAVRPSTKEARPRFIYDPSFEAADAERRYVQQLVEFDTSASHMPDEVTREIARRMHYAAWRWSLATRSRDVARWRKRYLEERNRIVVGNRKLVYRAVQKWAATPQAADDLISECQVVFIKIVAAYNPWLGIRFSTYAVTCLMRSLNRITKRQANDRLSQSRSLDAVPHLECSHYDADDGADPRLDILERYLRDGESLLTPRERFVITHRYHLNGAGHETETLEQVGRALGLSKERVRQVQNAALNKLREALLADGIKI
ncbi:MAG: sigma-70 family RNA polymerase sigma factor [Gemmataceae bacterium]|nr:sigma-70 family RNA polymerase sigma factor [Gemmataceae bacterium]